VAKIVAILQEPLNFGDFRHTSTHTYTTYIHTQSHILYRNKFCGTPLITQPNKLGRTLYRRCRFIWI